MIFKTTVGPSYNLISNDMKQIVKYKEDNKGLKIENEALNNLDNIIKRNDMSFILNQGVEVKNINNKPKQHKTKTISCEKLTCIELKKEYLILEERITNIKSKFLNFLDKEQSKSYL